MDRCEVKRCRADADLTYLGHGICTKHWDELISEDAPPDALRLALGLPAAHDTQEEAMDDGSKKATKVEAPAKVEATSKATKKAKPPKEPKTPREPKQKPEPRSREEFNGEVVVFAFRLGSIDRDRIHSAAGPAGATKFVRSAALAAATGDAKAFEALVTQAKSNLK